jgi:hypothetical protein
VSNVSLSRNSNFRYNLLAMRQKPKTTTILLLLMLFTAGQSVAAFSASCSMGNTNALQQFASTESPSTGGAPSHDHHAMAEAAGQSSAGDCCADAGACQPAHCAVSATAVSSPLTVATIAAAQHFFESSIPSPRNRIQTLFRPPIIV